MCSNDLEKNEKFFKLSVKESVGKKIGLSHWKTFFVKHKASKHMIGVAWRMMTHYRKKINALPNI